MVTVVEPETNRFALRAEAVKRVKHSALYGIVLADAAAVPAEVPCQSPRERQASVPEASAVRMNSLSPCEAATFYKFSRALGGL